MIVIIKGEVLRFRVSISGFATDSLPKHPIMVCSWLVRFLVFVSFFLCVFVVLGLFVFCVCVTCVSKNTFFTVFQS